MILFLLFGGIVLAGNFFHGGVAQYSQPYGSSSSSDQGGVYASGYSANSGTSGQYNSASYSPTATGQYSAYSSYNSPPSSSSSYSSNSGTYQPSGSLYSTSGQTSQYGSSNSGYPSYSSNSGSGSSQPYGASASMLTDPSQSNGQLSSSGSYNYNGLQVTTSSYSGLSNRNSLYASGSAGSSGPSGMGLTYQQQQALTAAGYNLNNGAVYVPISAAVKWSLNSGTFLPLFVSICLSVILLVGNYRVL